MSNAPILPDPIDRELVQFISELSTHWSPIDEQSLSSSAAEALKLVVRAAMAEGRLRLRMQMDGQPETLQVQVCMSGEYSGRGVFAEIAPHLPSGWLDAESRTRGRLRVKTSGFREARLTDQGELARQDLNDGQHERVVSFVRKTGFFQSRPAVSPQIRIENISVQDDTHSTSNDEAGRVVAVAQASVGDIDIQLTPTIHVHPTVHVHLDMAEIDKGQAGGADPEPAAVDPRAEWVFARDGNGFWVAGCSECGHVTSLVGFRHIESLLQHAGKPTSMVTLVGGGAVDESQLGPQSHQPAVDKVGSDRIHNQLREYDEQIAEAERSGRAGEVAMLQDERERLAKSLLADLGLGGQPRDINSRASKLRPRIHAALRRAYAALRKAEPPLSRLADHFELNIRSEGAAFIYAPESLPAWSNDRPK